MMSLSLQSKFQMIPHHEYTSILLSGFPLLLDSNRVKLLTISNPPLVSRILSRTGSTGKEGVKLVREPACQLTRQQARSAQQSLRAQSGHVAPFAFFSDLEMGEGGEGEERQSIFSNNADLALFMVNGHIYQSGSLCSRGSHLKLSFVNNLMDTQRMGMDWMLL